MIFLRLVGSGVATAVCSLSPPAGKGRVRDLYERDLSIAPLTRPRSAVDLAPQAGRGDRVAAPPHPHNCLLAIAAPSLSDLNFAHTIVGWISFEPANVAKPQSEPAITFSRPTTLA